MNNIDQFWRFMEGELLDGLHWEYWYHEGSSRFFFSLSSINFFFYIVIFIIKKRQLHTFFFYANINYIYTDIRHKKINKSI